jgi:hypothetical protein
MSEQLDKIGTILEDNKKKLEFTKLVEARMKQTDAIIEQYGLLKGQHVGRHTRKDPRTGSTFVAGQRGGSGSPESVLAEHKTVAPNSPVSAATGGKTRSPGLVAEMGDIVGTGEENMMNPAAFTPEMSIDNPDTLETVIRNLENATVEEITGMANDVFSLQRSQTRGRLAELVLKEIIRRGLVKESELEAQTNDMEKKLQKAQAKQVMKPAAKPAAKKD